MKKRTKAAAAGSTNPLIRRVNREITTAQYVRTLDERVSARHKASEKPVEKK